VCIFILGFMALLLYHLMTSIESLNLAETVDGLTLPLAEGWDVLMVLWPAMVFMFLAGIFTVLMIMKLWMPQNESKRIEAEAKAKNRCDRE